METNINEKKTEGKNKRTNTMLLNRYINAVDLEGGERCQGVDRD